jgi:hypothetical protein
MALLAESGLRANSWSDLEITVSLHEQTSGLCEPLVAARPTDAFAQSYLCIDITGVLVQANEKCRTGHFWVLVAPKRHVLFEFARSHDSDADDHVLAGYDRYLVADTYVVYDHLYSDGNVIESTVGHSVAHPAKNADQCFSYARRVPCERASRA